MLKELAELSKNENVCMELTFGPDDAVTVNVFALHKDYTVINPLTITKDEAMAFIKDTIRRAKEE